jgi:hypothetical protein
MFSLPNLWVKTSVRKGAGFSRESLSVHGIVKLPIEAMGKRLRGVIAVALNLEGIEMKEEMDGRKNRH